MAATVPMMTAGMLPARVTNRMASGLIPNSRMAIGTQATDGMDCSPVTRGVTATRTARTRVMAMADRVPTARLRV